MVKKNEKRYFKGRLDEKRFLERLIPDDFEVIPWKPTAYENEFGTPISGKEVKSETGDLGLKQRVAKEQVKRFVIDLLRYLDIEVIEAGTFLQGFMDEIEMLYYVSDTKEEERKDKGETNGK